MHTWDKYSENKAKTSKLNETKAPPQVSEYFFIKIIDNGLLVGVVVIMLLFAGVGFFGKLKNIPGLDWFFDMSKLAFGVILGMVAGKRTSK